MNDDIKLYHPVIIGTIPLRQSANLLSERSRTAAGPCPSSALDGSDRMYPSAPPSYQEGECSSSSSLNNNRANQEEGQKENRAMVAAPNPSLSMPDSDGGRFRTSFL